MTTLNTILLVVHVLISVMIVALIMIQRGKGAEAGAAFGAGASGTVFGARGSANFLSRSTAILAAMFFMTSLGLAYMGSQRTGPDSLMNQVPTGQVAPGVSAVPGTTPESTGTQAGGTKVPASELPSLPAAAVPAKAPAQAPAQAPAKAPASKAPATPGAADGSGKNAD
ncbi:MAG: preprotein translocase subunit SecG [Gammaproteobacteria bacterium PRO9]|nr:preprotein translocase subunit SecG [Gammaproteobacteria bacterium PRO9]